MSKHREHPGWDACHDPECPGRKRRVKWEAERGPWLLPEDGVIDERAIDAAVQGRPVRLTEREMKEVARRLGIPDHPVA